MIKYNQGGFSTDFDIWQQHQKNTRNLTNKNNRHKNWKLNYSIYDVETLFLFVFFSRRQIYNLICPFIFFPTSLYWRTRILTRSTKKTIPKFLGFSRIFGFSVDSILSWIYYRIVFVFFSYLQIWLILKQRVNLFWHNSYVYYHHHNNGYLLTLRMESQFFYQYILMIKDKITDNPSKANILGIE